MTIVKKKLSSETEIKYVKYSETATDTVIALGEYLGHEMKKNFDPTKPDVPLFKIKQEDGTVVGLNSASNLNPLLLPLSVGTVIEVVYKGKKSAKNKAGQTFKVGQFEVSELIGGLI